MKAETAKKYKFHFVSDLHLGSEQEPNFLLFLKYLQDLPKHQVTHLFLLGDIFDLWVADQAYFIEKYQKIVHQIQQLIDSGVEVHYFEGNHDFHLKKYWKQKVGAYIYEEPQRLSVCGVDLLLAHGDQIDKDDIGYIRLRKFFRSSIAKFIAFQLPGWITRKIGHYADQKSHGHQLRMNQDNSRIFKLVRGYAQESYEVMPYHFCMTGHFHVRDEFTIAEGVQSINLGTWLDRPAAYEITSESSGFVELSM